MTKLKVIAIILALGLTAPTLTGCVSQCNMWERIMGEC